MATVQDRTSKPAPAARYDAAVEAKLTRVRQRIRMLDVAVAVLGFLAVTLAFCLVMALLNRPPGLSPLARQVALSAYLLASAVYLGLMVVRPFFQRVNPYYAARQIEQTIPGAKNSIVNWLDLHQRQLPTSILGAVGHRAAKDAARAELEQTVNGRRAAWLGGAVGLLLLSVVIALVLIGPGQFLLRLGGVFNPFSLDHLPTRTRIEIVQPQGGAAAMPAGNAVVIVAQVEGRVPRSGKSDAMKLHYRHRLTDPCEIVPMENDNPNDGRQWTAAIPAFQVHSGFWYKVTGGDTETPEYQITIRPTPLIKSYETTYHYRPYLRWQDYTRPDGEIKDLRGTRVTLLVRANCPVREGRIELEKARVVIAGERVENDPHALRFQDKDKLILEQDDRYRIVFTSSDGETSESSPKTITVIPDYPPQLKLTQPEADEIQKPANGLLEVAGWASDDIGVQKMALRMQVVDGPVLQPRVYREGKSFQLSDGGYPKTLDYKDAVDLSKVKDQAGKDFALRPGMVVEYWLEAADACDYPEPHVAESKPRKRVTIGEPEKDEKKQEQQRQKAAQEQKQHQAKQDDKLKQEDEQRQRDAKANNPPKEAQPNPEQRNKDEQLQHEAQRVKDALEKKRQEEKERQEGQGKSDSQQPGAAKDGDKQEPQGEPRAEGKGVGQQDQKQQPGEKKEESKDQPGQQQSQAKGAGQSGGSEQQQPGEAKPDQQPSAKSQAKDAGREGQPQGQARDGGKPDPLNQAAQGQSKSAPPESGDGSEPARAEGKGQDRRSINQTSAKDAKQEDVDRLNKEMGSGNGAKQQDAAEKLDQISRNANDPKARESARQALQKAEQKPGKDAKSEDVAQQQRAMQNGDARQQQEAADKLDQMSRNAKDEKVREAARQALQKAEQRPGENAKAEDVAQQAKDLQGGDGAKKEQAAEKLEQMSRNAKDEQVRDTARQELAKAGQKPGESAKPEDVARQEKKLQQGDATQKRDAADKLEQLSRNAKDDKVRDAAREALKQAEQRPQESARPEDVARQAKDLQSDDPQKREQAANDLERMSRNAKDEKVREGARKALEKSAQKPGENAKPEDVARQQKQLQQGDPQQQREAADNLDRLSRNAKDEKVRDEARKALEKAIEQMQREQSPAHAKEQPPANPGAPKKGPPPEATPASAKQADPAQPPGEQARPKEGDPIKVDAQAKERGKPNDHPLAPYAPGTGERRNHDRAATVQEPAPGAADPRHRERGGDLQLEDLKNLDKKVRDELGWTEDRLRQFQKAYEEMKRRQAMEARTPDADKPTGPHRGGVLPNVGARQVKPTQGSPIDARSIGRGQAPPGYQDALREFTRRINALDEAPEKK